MSTPASTLIIPVETRVRELDAKLLLACVAAERGFPVVLGSRVYVHQQIQAFPRGVYLAKSLRPLSDRMFGILRQLGHDIVAFDEEGLVRFPDDVYWSRRLSPQGLQQVAILLGWGEESARIFRESPGYPGNPIHVTGNPRIDMMRPELRGYYEDQVRGLRDRFGDFILVNTNFAMVNAFVPALNLFLPGQPEVPGDAAVGLPLDFARGLAAHKRSLYGAFHRMVPALAEAFPGRTIVVRPHPSERFDPWQALAERYENVHVESSGNVVPWLLAAAVLVHNGCTTAVEAAVVETPAVAYRPVSSERYDLHLPNQVSHTAADLGELSTCIAGILDGKVGPLADEIRRPILLRHLGALEGPLAADRIVDVLEEAGYGSRCPPRPRLDRRIRGRAHLSARRAVKILNRRRHGHKNASAYHEHRFPPISVSELQERIERLGQQLGRFKKLRVERRGEWIFSIER